MKILLIGNLPEDRQESMLRFTTLLHTGLAERGHDVTLLSPTLRLARLGPRYHYNGLPKYLGYFDKFVLFPHALRRHVRATRPDVVHFTDHAGAVYASSVRGIPHLATCHDLLQVRVARGEIPGQQLSGTARWMQERILAGIARMPHLACVSEPTQADALRLTGLPRERLSVIPNSLNYAYQPIARAAARATLASLLAEPGLPDALQGGFLLHVGGDHWYKNRVGLIEIFAQLGKRLPSSLALVMVGPPLTSEQTALARELGVAGRIVSLSGISNPQLEAFYNLAQALVFPSWEEGFGWPVAEAQACGCPVFASDRAPMTQVGGAFSAYFDPADTTQAARSIAEAWPSRYVRRDHALADAARWRPAPMLDAYEKLYGELSR